MNIRSIQKGDNSQLSKVIKDALMEFGAAKPGTVYYDPWTDSLYEYFQKHTMPYFVVEECGEILGGCGLFHTEGLPADTIELVKLYLAPKARGKGLGERLIQICAEEAKQRSFKHLYLESLPELNKAVRLYEKLGFVQQKSPLGNSGHFGCNLWMIKSLD
ncbi:MAG: GNAT family N-acetyltransferase [Crocinitomicaceae bacterium]|jgi:putative acetyltransferase|nr:GNAT family N-acetyltransferase [Crocinitomicaceae bacterium]